MTPEWWWATLMSVGSWSITALNFAYGTTLIVSHIRTHRLNRETMKMIMDMETEVELREGVTTLGLATSRPETYLLHDTKTGQVWGWHPAALMWVDTGRRALKGSRSRRPVSNPTATGRSASSIRSSRGRWEASPHNG